MQIDDVDDLRQLANQSMPESKVIIEDGITGKKYRIITAVEISPEGKRNSELTFYIKEV